MQQISSQTSPLPPSLSHPVCKQNKRTLDSGLRTTQLSTWSYSRLNHKLTMSHTVTCFHHQEQGQNTATPIYKSLYLVHVELEHTNLQLRTGTHMGKELAPFYSTNETVKKFSDLEHKRTWQSTIQKPQLTSTVHATKKRFQTFIGGRTLVAPQ